jgi:hypothetical protein
MSDLYTLESLGDGYYRDTIIEEYESLIWTERFIDAGDVKLLIPATAERYDLLEPSTLLGLNGSREVMIVETREVNEGELSVTGRTIETYFNERNIDAFEMTDKPENILAAIVQNMIDRAESSEMGPVSPTHIPRLMVGEIEASPAETHNETEKIAAGPAYDEMLRVAKKYAIDMHVYVVRGDVAGYDLHFTTHYGKDRTGGSGNGLIRFAPALDNFANITELRSDLEYKSSVVAHLPEGLDVAPLEAGPVKIMKVPNGDVVYQPFKERIVEITPEITNAMIADNAVDASHVAAVESARDLLERYARRKLRTYEKTDTFSGEVTPNAQYKYSEDVNEPDYYKKYRLGDKVEVGGTFGAIRTGYITEHVRAYDNSGVTSYPTIGQVPRDQSDPDFIS